MENMLYCIKMDLEKRTVEVLIHECLIMRKTAEIIASKLEQTGEELDKIKILNKAQEKARNEIPFEGTP